MDIVRTRSLPVTLFSKVSLHAFCEQQLATLAREIDTLAPDVALQTDLDELATSFVARYTLTVPTFDRARITVENEEVKIDVSKDPQRRITDRSRPFFIAGTRITYYVPYDGDEALLHVRPSQYNLSPPVVTIGEHELLFSYNETKHDANALQQSFNLDLQRVESWLRWIEHDLPAYHTTMNTAARERLTRRREKLKKDQQLTATLGYPLRPRTDAPPTYIPRRKRIALPQRPSKEPVLEASTYDDILRIIQSMALVLERSPAVFHGMNEEDLRTHFLVQLNGQYEGEATGETFNGNGKTDILIRQENKNLFIAECKFWNGPASLTDAINQLLGYTSWRDTKTAILLFSRNKNFTDVLAQIAPTVAAHPNTIRQEVYPSETGYRFTLYHQHDKDRHLTLTILAFNIP